VQGVLDLFPKSAYFCMTAMSEKALAYFAESLEHRFMVLFEAEGMSGKFATYFVRSLLSEGCLKYDTVERGPDGPRAKHIERPGPTGLITTTTLPKLHPENETRFFSVPVNDTPEQTARILLAIAGNRAQAHQIDLAAWIKFQEWLSTGERRVIVPYAENLAGLVPPLAIRLRRDFPALLTLIESHALLHRESRERDQEERIVATMEDYAAIKELVADLISEGVSASVSPTIRETVEAVKVLYEQFPYGVSLSELAKALKLDKSVVSRRVAAAEKDHYLLNEEPQRGKPARLRVGEPLPDEVQVLPTVETLDRCSVAA
jgi:hypothetical protein